MHVLILHIDARVPASQSLKNKRAVLQSLVRRIDQLHSVGAAEVGGQDSWQRLQLGASIVGDNVSQVEAIADSIERMVWAEPQLEVLEIEQTWADC